MTSPSALAALDVHELVAVLPDLLPQPSALQQNDWLLLVGLLTDRIVEGAERLGPDDWPVASRAELHVLAMAERAGGIDHWENVIRRINLTSALLYRVAADDEVPIRSPQAAFGLLFDNLPISLDDALRLAPEWRELDISEMRRLRNAKNLLTPALAINEHVRDPRISAWEEVYRHLP